MNIADQCIALFRETRKSLMIAAKLLWQVREEGAFNGKWDNFSDYLEQGCGISRGYGSKLLASYEHYILNGGLSEDKVAKVDVDKLYNALSLKGTPAEQLSKALTLTRRDIKELRADEDGHVCEGVTLVLCKTCNKRME